MITMLQGVFITSIISALAVQDCTCVKIIGGHNAKPGTGSYMALIQDSVRNFCGGVLIDKLWVLTSANCAVKQLSVSIGTHSFEDRKKAQTFEVVEAKVHNKYNIKTEWNNLALLKLNTTAKLNKLVNTLSLPKSAKDIKPGTKCKVLGWGQTIPNETVPSDMLQETTVTIIDRKICNSKKYYNKNPVVNDDMLCAGAEPGNQAKMCGGDIGGPLICKSSSPKSKSLTGIAIFAKGCDKTNKPGIYTRLSNKYIQWIKKTIKSKTKNVSIEQK